MSQKSVKGLSGGAFEKLGISDDNANCFIENCFDALIELIRAEALLTGLTVPEKGRMRQRWHTCKLGFSERTPEL